MTAVTTVHRMTSLSPHALTDINSVNIEESEFGGVKYSLVTGGNIY